MSNEPENQDPANKRKESTKQCIERYLGKVERKRLGPTRKNQKPEKEVERDCLHWMRSQGWDVNIYEAKATYDPRAGRYRQQSMKAGTVDCQGNTHHGEPVFIEFKAPGCRSNFNRQKSAAQKDYLLRKIQTNCFAVVVDNASQLQRFYEVWRMTKESEGNEVAVQYLMGVLP